MVVGKDTWFNMQFWNKPFIGTKSNVSQLQDLSAHKATEHISYVAQW